MSTGLAQRPTVQSTGTLPSLAGFLEADGVAALALAIQENEDVAEAITTAARLTELRDWLRVSKRAQKLRQEAVQLECIALRRCAQLGGLEDLPESERKLAGQLAQVDDQTFEQMVKLAKASSSPSTIFSEHLGNASRAAFMAMLPGFADDLVGYRGDGERFIPRPDTDFSQSLDEIKYNASSVLDGLIGSMDAFTVSGAADILAERLEQEDVRAGKRQAGWRTPSARNALRVAIRDAMKQAKSRYSSEVFIDGPDEPALELPETITFYQTDFNFVHIPAHVARLGHLEAMAKYRLQQATNDMRVATDLQRIVDNLYSVADPEQPALQQKVTDLVDALHEKVGAAA